MTTIHNNLRLLGKGVMGLLSRADVTATLSVLSLAAAPAFAGPEGEQVVRGDVRFERRGNEMWITAGRNSIINYRTFNIASGETVRFIQPDAQSRVLNRVTTAAPTRIDGSLLANGRVYIVNPAGVYFGQNAVVDVNGLHAAAGRMSDADFVRGVDRYTHMRGSVINEGQIRANAVALVGQQVGNFGSIVAPQGTVVLAAGQDVIVGERGGNVVVRIPRTSGGTTSVLISWTFWLKAVCAAKRKRAEKMIFIRLSLQKPANYRREQIYFKFAIGAAIRPHFNHLPDNALTSLHPHSPCLVATFSCCL